MANTTVSERGPHSPAHLDRPVDERMTNRRPSDEASMILRKISGAGMPFGMMNLGVSLPDKTMSLPPFPRNPMENSSFQDFLDLAKQPQILGRQMTAVIGQLQIFKVQYVVLCLLLSACLTRPCSRNRIASYMGNINQHLLCYCVP